MTVRAICVDDKNKPKEIPQDKWVKKDQPYTITNVFVMRNQECIQGCEIAEHDISRYAPYNCYRLSRFAILVEDLPILFEMIRTKNGLGDMADIDIQKLIDDVPVKKKEELELV